MENYREHRSELDLSSTTEAEAAALNNVAATVVTDERRMHARAYNHWVSLLDGRDFPSIDDLEPGDVADFSDHSVLLDFSCGLDNPALSYIGATIRDECDLGDDAGTVAEVPSRSLLSRLTNQYQDVIINRAPVGFEAEFTNPRGETLCYRGILMPFSSDGETIDFIYGVVDWKTVDAAVGNEPAPFEVQAHEPTVTRGPELRRYASLSMTDVLRLDDEIVDASALDSSPEPIAVEQSAAIEEPSRADGPLAEVEEVAPPMAEPGDAASLAERLRAARETVESVKAGEGRTRADLYRALALAHDFAVAADRDPGEYEELLAASGVRVQARAPMTAIVKLVFGVDYDKTRLTEFAAALSYAKRHGLGLGEFQRLIEQQPGGLKALVAAERQERRPERKPDTRGEAARARLRSAPPFSLAQLPSDEEFALVVTRRGADGRHELVAQVMDEALVERVIRKAG